MTRRLPDYGYRLDLQDPDVLEAYERFKASRGIPRWVPLSDNERLEFERAYIRGQRYYYSAE